MINKLILYLFSFCTIAFADTSKENIKKQIAIEFDLLLNDLKDTQSKINKLRDGKRNLEADLKNMTDWAVHEQEEKLIYYNDKIAIESALNEEKAAHQITKNKYVKLKHLAGYILAGLFLFAYFALLAPGINEIAPFLGHWQYIVKFGSPAFAVALGYYSAQIFL